MGAEALDFGPEPGEMGGLRGKMDIHFSSKTGVWGTPQWLYDKLNDEFSFGLDACADANNFKHDVYFDEAANALTKDWRAVVGDGCVFMNPPYGRGIDKWVKKAKEEADKGTTVVCLLPARVDTAWFFDTCFGEEIRLVRGRLHFTVTDAQLDIAGKQDQKRTDPAPFPSMVVVMGPGSKKGRICCLDARGKR